MVRWTLYMFFVKLSPAETGSWGGTYQKLFSTLDSLYHGQKQLRHFRVWALVQLKTRTLTNSDVLPVIVSQWQVQSGGETLAMFPSKVVNFTCAKLKCRIKTFANKALFLPHVFKRTKSSLPGNLVQNIGNKNKSHWDRGSYCCSFFHTS